MSSYQEILSQIEALKVQAEDVRKQEISSAIAEIKRIMSQYDITLADLGGTGRVSKSKTKGSTVAAKYRDPLSGKTWTGRGRRPAWVVDLEAAGSSLDSCRI